MDAEYYAQTERYIHEGAMSQTTKERISIVTQIVDLFDVRKAADYGAGRGDLCIALAQKGVETCSIDVTGNTSAYAASRYQDAGLDIKSLSPDDFCDSPDNFLELVTCFDVFEHLDNPLRIIHRIWRKLAPEGTLVLSADLHNFNDEAHISDHFIYEPFLIELIENIGFVHLDSLIQGRPSLRDNQFTFGSIRLDCFRKIMADSSPLDRYRRMAKRFNLR